MPDVLLTLLNTLVPMVTLRARRPMALTTLTTRKISVSICSSTR